MSFLKEVLRGIAIGVANIIPGILDYERKK